MSQLAATVARYLPARRPVWVSAEYTALASGTTWLASARRVAVLVDVENIRHGIKDGRRRYRGIADRTGNFGIIATALPDKQVETAGIFRRLALVIKLSDGTQAVRHQLGHEHFDRIRDETDHTVSAVSSA